MSFRPAIPGFISSTAVACLTGLLAVVSPAPGHAAEFLQPSDGHAAPGSAEETSRAYLEGASGPLALRGVNLVAGNVLDAGACRTVRWSQHWNGLPVLGASAAVRLGPDGRIVAVMLDVARGLELDDTPTWPADLARDAIGHRRNDRAADGAPALLAVLPWPAGEARLVWVLDVPSMEGGRRYVVDAHRGTLLSERPLAMRAMGRVYPISQVVTPEAEDRALLHLSSAQPQVLTGWDGQLAVTNFVAYGPSPGEMVLQQTVVANEGGDFLFDPPADPTDPSDSFAQVNAYYHLTRARDFFAASFGLDMSGPAWKLVAGTNLLDNGAPFDGAYFSPAGVSSPWNSPNFLGTGQGSQIDFAYDSDVFLHEFAHYVNYNAVNYNAGQFAFDDQGWSPFSIAIDEGVADYFACTLNDDALVGEATLGPMGKLRNLADTSKRCPDDVVGEGHLDGGLIGSLAWSLREAFDGPVADQLVWGAVSMLPYNASFADFTNGLLQTARDLVETGSLASDGPVVVQELVRQRGLDDCGRVISLPPGESRKTLMFGLDAIADAYDTTCEQLQTVDGSIPGIFQFKTKAIPGATGIRFSIDLTPNTPGKLEWAVYVRAGEPVRFEPGNPIPLPAHYDYAADRISETHFELAIDSSSSPVFDPAADYHVLLTHRNCPGVMAVLSSEAATADQEVEPEAAAGMAVGGGCRSSAGGHGGGTWAFLVLGMAAARRWRARGPRRR